MGVNKEILRLSVPAIVSNITVPLLGLCDTGISGHLGSEIFLAAIAVGSMMMNVVVWLFGFLRMGTTGMTANAYGSGDDLGVRRMFSASLLLALLLGGLLILLRHPILEALLAVIGPEPEVHNLVSSYFMICIGAAPALLGTMAISGWFVGMQSTVWPMAIAISVNVINMIASFSLVFYFDMGFIGVAWGTFTANICGFILALIAVSRFRKGRKILAPFSSLCSRGLISRFFSVNSNLFLRSMCIISVSLGVTAAGARLGAMTLAVNAVMMQFFTLFSFFMDGFAFSAEALIGKSYGAADRIMMRRCVKALLIWASGVALVFTIFYLAGSGLITSILTDEQDVRAGVKSMRLWIWLIPAVSVWAFIYDGFYIGITDTGKMLMATFTATMAFIVGAFVKFSSDGIAFDVTSNVILWGAFLAYLGLRGIILAAMWPHELHSRFSPVKTGSAS